MYVLEISTVSVEWVAPSLLIFLVLFIPATIFSAGVFYHQNKFLTDVDSSQSHNDKGEKVEKGQGTEKLPPVSTRVEGESFAPGQE